MMRCFAYLKRFSLSALGGLVGHLSGWRGFLRRSSGQMAVEFVVVFPVALAVAVIAINAIQFFGECAAFDREARNAVRVYATSPAYGEGADQALASVQGYLDSQLKRDYVSSQVACSGKAGELMMYTATLRFQPNLFGRGMRSEVLGIPMPPLTHQVSLTVNPYNPGVVF